MNAQRFPSLTEGEPTLFRLEPENFAAAGQLYLYAVASKRKTPYAITHEGPQPISPSEFALGHLLKPTGSPLGSDGVAAAWSWAALAGEKPEWIDGFALAHIPLTRHADLSRLRHGGAEPRPWDTLVVAQVDRVYGAGLDGTIPRPVSIYRNGETPAQAEWRDFATGSTLPPAQLAPHNASEHALSAERPLFLRSLRSVLAAHIRAPERKALRPDGEPCTSRTEGILRPAPTEAYNAVAIGREANYGEEAGVLHDPTYTLFPEPGRDLTGDRVLAILRNSARMDGHGRLATELELSESALRRYLRTGRARAATRTRALQQAAVLAETALTRAHPGEALPAGPEALLYLGTREHGPFANPRCAACRALLEGRQRRWCRACREQPRRRRHCGPDEWNGDLDAG